MATLLSTTLAASITFHNTSPHPICYMVQFTSGTLPTTTTCVATAGVPISGPGFTVAAGQTITLNPSPNFNGAITAINADKRQGVRNEINYQGDTTWFDVDYENGMSDGTLGPASHQPLINGGASLSGEQDCLGKANAAWSHTSNKAALLAFPTYLGQGPDGKLNHVYMDTGAPQVVVEFFKNTADFTGYVVFDENRFSWSVKTLDMEVIAY